MLLEVKDISKNFGGLRAVDNVSFTVEQGKISGLIGPNGAGKTTVFNLITRFLPLDSGHIYFRSQDITELPPYELVDMGVVRSWQGLRLFYRMTVIDNILMAMPHQKGENIFTTVFAFRAVSKGQRELQKRALSYLDFVKLAGKAGELVQNLSFAEQKLLSIARLLATEAELFLLDEPTSGMDIATVKDIMFPLISNLVRKQGKTVCIVEHSLDVVRELCDWVLFLDQGQMVAQGTASQIMSDPRLGKIYFGI